jgi:hypothetical protein
MKKAPIAVALVLVFGLFAAALSLSPAIAQNTTTDTNTTGTTSTNATSTTNATTTATTNATGGETFSARGSIASLIFHTGETTTTSEVEDTTTTSNDTSTANMTASGNATISFGDNSTTMMPQIMTGENATISGNLTSSSNMTDVDNTTSTETSTSTAAEEMEPPYVLAGDWNLDVEDGSVSDFAANFTMVHIDGTERHTHELSNFVSSNSSTIDTSEEGTSFIFGTVDVATDGESAWTSVDALLIIEKNNVLSISLATEDTDDHFQGQPIYGVVDSMTDENGNEMVQGATQTADNTTGNFTQSAEDAANETGEFLGNITSGIEDLFNGTGQ